jgi:hypothetical protein
VHQVRDGNRVLQFDGDQLAHSSSQRPGEHRWVEFDLFRTKSGSYVLGRVGHTRLFHDPGCAIVRRNSLKPTESSELTDEHVPCDACDPYYDQDEVCIEQPRYFALVSDSPEAVLDALYKYDSSGARYLTLVAQRLIEKAGEQDARLDKAYRIEYIY